MSSYDFTNSENYTLRLARTDNLENFQDINFYFSDLELGDVNIDGEIDALDAILVLEIILDDLGYNQNADINEDMNIDLLDIIIIINIIIT